MLGADRIIQEAQSLSIEDRLRVLDSLLLSLNPPDPTIDSEWAVTAKRRLAELQSGQVKPVPGEQVFARLSERFPTS